MKVLSSNKHEEYPQKLFEVGDVVVFDEGSDTKVRNVRKLAGVLSYDTANLTELKSIVENVLNNLGYLHQIVELDHASFIQTRCGEIKVDGEPIGLFGEISPKVLVNWQLEKPVIAFEMNLV